jgi:ATP-dependent DNA ligase
LLRSGLEPPIELSPLVDPSVALVDAMERGNLEGIVLKDRTSTYRDRSRAGWAKVKDRTLVRTRGVAVRLAIAVQAA